ncbi:NAD(P)/FAD-dependent oxidoreductase [Robertmurraya yapensis]|uniref:NAD(P)/FAD-dependent oxidoreductase n=1 Tax=Bacillus yapensis TaxID=2492960 RepID=A0A3S0KLB8_9BACI|nr:NAD(P)/FAD-dependent oxidoreductase [Bacillus yapensis]RTR33082.1 NAD(P)/FAD-dependent oxidoreductase [Bacillus yapensis]TKS96905.1 FAD-binding protein [Bacillus yapensis]
MIYDCIIIGGGIAGLQAAIQLGRYMHKVLVIDAGDGRSTICQSYHNILGYPDGVSGEHLRTVGQSQAEKLGVQFLLAKVEGIERAEEFIVTVHNGTRYHGKRILIATGVMDRLPELPELFPCLGQSVYVCPDCDGYEIKDKPTIVLGSGNVGANMALTLTYWTDNLIYINHELQKIDADLLQRLNEKQITYYEVAIKSVLAQGHHFQGVILENKEKLEADRGFVAFGSNEVKSQLAKQLGVELLENKHIVVDPRTKMTIVKNVWAAGDIVAHSEQVTIAMGDGAQAAIWIHKSLLESK